MPKKIQFSIQDKFLLGVFSVKWGYLDFSRSSLYLSLVELVDWAFLKLNFFLEDIFYIFDAIYIHMVVILGLGIICWSSMMIWWYFNVRRDMKTIPTSDSTNICFIWNSCWRWNKIPLYNQAQQIKQLWM